MATRFIALLSDFGERDWFVASLKAVIAGINPEARTVDISHEVPSFDVRAASFILSACCGYFPDGTVFLSVVDPGVAGRRAVLLAETRRHFFIAPDNGLLTLPLRNEKIIGLRRVTERRFWLSDRISTFEGRDRMAPVAAWLTHGVAPSEFGPAAGSHKKLRLSPPVRFRGGISGEVLYEDKFGNLLTNIPASMLPGTRATGPQAGALLELAQARIDRFVGAYSEARNSRPFFLVNSLGLVEIAVREGSAATALGARPGDPVRLRFAR